MTPIQDHGKVGLDKVSRSHRLPDDVTTSVLVELIWTICFDASNQESKLIFEKLHFVFPGLQSSSRS